ncbi:MAG: 2,3-bisphosphoglycerate-independent phosphoglycerate mutase [Cyanobacteria bacterium]|nr:2,3-bisphosphoglycerate-independent phosphoglycerate mutase [Cyanobacteria bacterium CG_2015-16_32_12]NCO78778.1 2,3-bisphosphoglycerate-independent phosphoglycerate mutase [Cyanobacteria bacterium CG_2015-22_32_23]NCQ05273.1 2,3-bisphosphoglycerate-independent phosphoglycerate mutase [Cyanobacteria bacterium CG_2015-09_32_10]NCQ42092.1 2,3-bisphosphoglycerate-independent phosphoglycerate mutase [Cyanobacteria bacterium CG_2015-04_32_10]NCS86085.1 2,3-bisphosphoglycerate-independent phosphog
MNHETISPVVLVILDGWGYREDKRDNAIALAKTPVMDSLLEVNPNTLINASGKAVGLPNGQMGNSEVGHLNLGAGRVVPQELVRISDAVEDGSIFTEPVLEEICHQVIQSQGKLHLMGLCSDGGVHSHLDHLIGLLDLAKLHGVAEVCVHFIADGRDTKTHEGIKYIKTIEEHIQKIGLGKIVTVCGRYYAMDRDHRWDRIKRAYDLYTIDGVGDGRNAVEVMEDSYAQNLTDEFIEPTRIAEGAIKEGDGVIFYNFRPDRARQICYAFTMDDFDGFEREKINNLSFVTFTQYDPNLPVKVVFAPQQLTNILGEVIANAGLKQFRTSETEKYPHVTYFFNGGLEQPLEGEDRELVQSPMVLTYDKAPAMSAVELTNIASKAITKGIYSFVVINYANPDMVGHTGKLDKAEQAIETVDTCVGKLLRAINQVSGTTIITADHGNAEYMKDEKGNPWTAHTTNQVPFILVEGEGRKIIGHGGNVKLRENGKLADVAPTILEILQLPKPKEMTGESLIEKSEYEVKKNRTPVSISV